MPAYSDRAPTRQALTGLGADAASRAVARPPHRAAVPDNDGPKRDPRPDHDPALSDGLTQGAPKRGLNGPCERRRYGAGQRRGSAHEADEG